MKKSTSFINEQIADVQVKSRLFLDGVLKTYFW